ncbi:MAG: alpha/beta fold hydrolase [Myxococcales bacterium]|nr:alpha/beta fold hydrolase [Myxococcales bacterium]
MSSDSQNRSGSQSLKVGLFFAAIVLLSAWFAGVFDVPNADIESEPNGAVQAQSAQKTDEIKADKDKAALPPAPTVPAPEMDSAARRPSQIIAIAASPANPKGPVVVGLHGRGDTVMNFSQLSRRYPAQLAWRFVGAKLPFGRGKAWFLRDEKQQPTGIDDSVADIYTAVNAVGQHRKIALFGFSQGCMMIIHYLTQHPDSVAAAVCIGGSVIGPLQTHISSDARPPILFVGGTEDRVVPAAGTKDAIARLEALGFPTEHIEHFGGHSIPKSESQRIGQWLLDKTR